MSTPIAYRLLLQTGENIDGPIYKTLRHGRAKSPEAIEARARRESETFHCAPIWIATGDTWWAVQAHTCGEG